MALIPELMLEQGSGYILKSIVECHGGHIRFDTGQHKGTVFHNYLQLLYQS